MLEMVRQMLINVTISAIFAGISLQFVKEGPLHEVLRVAVGITMTLALMLPVIRGPSSEPVFADVFDGLGNAAAYAAEENSRIAASSVGNAIAAYIEDRASEMGIPCTAAVHMAADETGKLVTEGVTLYLENASEEEQEAVCQMVVQECGIPIYLLEVRGR